MRHTREARLETRLQKAHWPRSQLHTVHFLRRVESTIPSAMNSSPRPLLRCARAARGTIPRAPTLRCLSTGAATASPDGVKPDAAKKLKPLTKEQREFLSSAV
jgi:hypothetical protein